MTAKRPRGLGRGLDALLSEGTIHRITGAERATAERGAGDSPLGAAGRLLQTLPIELLRPSANQPRRAFNDDAIEELARSIRVRGLLQPILVRRKDDGWEIVAGERRWRAAQRAALHDVPVVIRELSDEDAAEIALIENVQRVDLNPIEEASAYHRLVEAHKRTQDEIARAVGKSRSHISNMIRLMALPAKCRKALEDGALSMGHARALLAAKDPDAALGAVLKGDLSVRDTERFVKRLNEGPSPPSGAGEGPAKPSVPGKKDADTRALEADLAAALGLEIAIDHSPKGSGVVSIRYRSLDQLDDVCKRLMGAGV